MLGSNRPRSIDRATLAVAVVIWLGLLVGLVGVANAGPSPRDPDAAHGGELVVYRQAVDAGTAAFRDGRYGEARAAFERAFAIHDDPVLLFNIASCWRREGQSVQAVAAYLRFLDLAPVSDPRRTLATETVATLEAELAAINAPPPVPAAPPPVVKPRAAAEPRIEVSDDDGEDDEAAAPLVPLPAAPAAHHARSVLRPAGIALTTVGALTLVAAGVETMRARSLEDDVEGYRNREWGRDEADTYARGESTARRAIILGIAGGVAVAGGVTLFYLGRSHERAVQVGAAPSAGGGTVVMAGRF